MNNNHLSTTVTVFGSPRVVVVHRLDSNSKFRRSSFIRLRERINYYLDVDEHLHRSILTSYIGWHKSYSQNLSFSLPHSCVAIIFFLETDNNIMGKLMVKISFSNVIFMYKFIVSKWQIAFCIRSQLKFHHHVFNCVDMLSVTLFCVWKVRCCQKISLALSIKPDVLLWFDLFKNFLLKRKVFFNQRSKLWFCVALKIFEMVSKGIS